MFCSLGRYRVKLIEYANPSQSQTLFQLSYLYFFSCICFKVTLMRNLSLKFSKWVYLKQHHHQPARTADLSAIQSNPRLFPVAEHLPQRHTKHPAVTGVRKLTRLQTLRSTPEHISAATRSTAAGTGRSPAGIITHSHYLSHRFLSTSTLLASWLGDMNDIQRRKNPYHLSPKVLYQK